MNEPPTVIPFAIYDNDEAAAVLRIGLDKLDKLVADGGEPAQIIETEGLGALGDDGELDGIVEAALAANADAAEKIRGGNMKAIGPIIGHVMRETKGRADGGDVTRIVREKLGL